jgi:hypothetical protein
MNALVVKKPVVCACVCVLLRTRLFSRKSVRLDVASSCSSEHQDHPDTASFDVPRAASLPSFLSSFPKL